MIIIVGPGGSGKDYLAAKLVELGYRKAVSCTTRPMRDGERDGVDYHFLSKTAFLRKVAQCLFREWYTFGVDNWHYGTLLQEFRDASLFIMSPAGLRALDPDERAAFRVVYLDIPEDVRRRRLEARGGADSVQRRLDADTADFDGFDLYDVRITDPLFTPAAVLAQCGIAPSHPYDNH